MPGIAFAGLGIVIPVWLTAAAHGVRAQRRLHAERAMVLATGSIYLVGDLLAPPGRRRVSML